jgi:hypothetical protein
MIDHTLNKYSKTTNIKPIRPICGKVITTTDNNRRPCLREEGHDGGCNPFSDTPPLNTFKPR